MSPLNPNFRYFEMTVKYNSPLIAPYTFPEPIPITELPQKIFIYGGTNVEEIVIKRVGVTGV